MPLIGFSVFQNQVEAGLKYEGKYWELVDRWLKDPTVKPSPIGLKCQTIRVLRYYKGKPNPVKVGDKLYLYTGLRTKKCRKLGEAICTETFFIGMDVDPKDLRPFPDGETRIWKLVPLGFKVPVLEVEHRAEGLFTFDVETLAMLDGFNKKQAQIGQYVYNEVQADFINREMKRRGSAERVQAGDSYTAPIDTPNSVDMISWFSKTHGDVNGKIDSNFFQVIRWEATQNAC
jgi:hypothetical protein